MIYKLLWYKGTFVPMLLELRGSSTSVITLCFHFIYFITMLHASRQTTFNLISQFFNFTYSWCTLFIITPNIAFHYGLLFSLCLAKCPLTWTTIFYFTFYSTFRLQPHCQASLYFPNCSRNTHILIHIRLQPILQSYHLSQKRSEFFSKLQHQSDDTDRVVWWQGL